MGCLCLHDVAAGRGQHAGHQAQGAVALRHDVRLHVAIVIPAGARPGHEQHHPATWQNRMHGAPCVQQTVYALKFCVRLDSQLKFGQGQRTYLQAQMKPPSDLRAAQQHMHS